MSLWIEPVIDRTQEDVEEAQRILTAGWDALDETDRQKWNAGLKGALNRSDLERIESDIQVLSEKLYLGLKKNEISSDFPAESYFSRLKENVDKIREMKIVHSDTPNVPELPFNTYEKINDIERILLDAYEILRLNFHHYAGEEIYAGDTIGLLL